jgi:hypothetical protein
MQGGHLVEIECTVMDSQQLLHKNHIDDNDDDENDNNYMQQSSSCEAGTSSATY